MESFGEYIKRQRELREISVDEVSDKTKISRFYIEALEKDNFDVLPGQAFIKGFLRSYSNYVGLDSGEVITRYIDHCNKVLDSSKKEEIFSDTTTKKSRLHLIITFTIIGIMLLIFFAVIVKY